MSLYQGPSFTDGNVSLGAVDLDDLSAALSDADIAGEKERWPGEAVTRADIVYFGVRHDGDLVGQFFLHDIDEQANEALLGYDLFDPRLRGLGIGTAALRLVQTYVAGQTRLKRLVVITGKDNPASRRMCMRCGFAEIGPSREDPERTVAL